MELVRENGRDYRRGRECEGLCEATVILIVNVITGYVKDHYERFKGEEGDKQPHLKKIVHT